MSLPSPIIHETSVAGVRLYEMPCCMDPNRGNLTVGECRTGLPFQPLRYFLTFGIPDNQTRGNHAHRLCAQFILSVHGECQLHVDDGSHQAEFKLDRPTLGVFVPPLIWATQQRHSGDSVLLVLASLPYEEEDYIRDYADFLMLARP